MKIKICGLFRNEDIDYVNEALPDYIGFVFAKSKRQITPKKAGQLKHKLDKRISAVGVFVDADIDFIADLVHNRIIDAVQLHGSENETYVDSLREKLPERTPIIKAFSVSCMEDIINAKDFPCDYMLLDNGKGGTGQSFPWKLLKNNMPENVFLAGGINTENIIDAAKLAPYCIDVSSGAEINGVKDKNKILQLVQAVRKD